MTAQEPGQAPFVLSNSGSRTLAPKDDNRTMLNDERKEMNNSNEPGQAHFVLSNSGSRTRALKDNNRTMKRIKKERTSCLFDLNKCDLQINDTDLNFTNLIMCRIGGH